MRVAVIVEAWGIVVLAVGPALFGAALGFLVARMGTWTIVDELEAELGVLEVQNRELQTILRHYDVPVQGTAAADPDLIRQDVRSFWSERLGRAK